MTTQIAREETRCRHIGYSFRLAAMVLLYERVLRILKINNLIVKPTEVVDIKVWCNNRYGVLTCPNKLKGFKYPS